MKDHILNFLKSILQRKALFSFTAECLVTFAWLYGWSHVGADGHAPTGVGFSEWQIFTAANFGAYSGVNITEKAKGLNGSAGAETPTT